MDNQNECYGIIPARYASTRFPGKPLANIAGKPMFWHVYNNARKCPELSKVFLATDDKRIVSAAKAYDVPVVETIKDHPSGTDRVLEAAQLLNLSDSSIVVNIQGDEPLINPDMLTQIVKPFIFPQILITTLAREIRKNEAENINQVKVVFSRTGKALYFSRMPIPCYRDGQDGVYFGHIGLYAFRMKTLEQFVSLGPSSLESAEQLEQLRLLENDISVHVVITEHESMGVDVPEDIQVISEILNKRNS